VESSVVSHTSEGGYDTERKQYDTEEGDEEEGDYAPHESREQLSVTYSSKQDDTIDEIIQILQVNKIHSPSEFNNRIKDSSDETKQQIHNNSSKSLSFSGKHDETINNSSKSLSSIGSQHHSEHYVTKGASNSNGEEGNDAKPTKDHKHNIQHKSASLEAQKPTLTSSSDSIQLSSTSSKSRRATKHDLSK
jgi:hypothetical protein